MALWDKDYTVLVHVSHSAVNNFEGKVTYGLIEAECMKLGQVFTDWYEKMDECTAQRFKKRIEKSVAKMMRAKAARW